MRARSLVAALIIPALGLAACSGQQEGANAKSRRTVGAHLVEVSVAAREPAELTHTVAGGIRARHTVSLYSQEEGTVTYLPVFEGDRVEKNQVLVRLDDRLLTAELEKSTATRRQESLDLKRLQELNQKKIASDDELAQAQTALDVARADEAMLRTRLAYTVIKAPFDGVISRRLVEPGSVVSRHTHLLTLIAPDSLVAQVDVSELLLAELSVGDVAQVRIDALGEQRFEGRILRIHPTLDSRTRRGVVEVEMDPLPEGARSGQLCRVTFHTPTRERLLIPFRSIQRDRDGEYVMVVGADNKTARRTVETGARVDDQIEILNGVTEGDRVVLRGFLGLREGHAVEVVDGIRGQPAT